VCRVQRLSTLLGIAAIARLHLPRESSALVTSLMDSNTTPSQQLAKQITASTGQDTGSLFSQISENPFFTAVRSIPVVVREAGCAYDCCRALVSQRLV
jgi:hypothetical protein